MCDSNVFRFSVNFHRIMFFEFFVFVTFAFLPIQAAKCGLDACNPTDPNKINVHLIAHTHDDVGWLKTVDQYYYGANKGHAPFGVEYILDSVISELDRNPARRFIYVETAFFWRWYEELEDNVKEMVKRLVNDGKLEFVHGGWCMSDEATPHYTMMIDQMTLGLKYLNDTFGECGRPSVSWQIDPFGHSSEVALEFADMGFSSLFVARIDYEDDSTRKSNKQLEVIWRPDTSLGESGEIFFHKMHDTYTAPAGFCFDVYCGDEPIMDNKKLHGYNVNERIAKFAEHVETFKKSYRTNHILIPMGGDFNYIVASSWFKNIDKLIKYTNAKYPSINLLYSTPACYANALNSLNITWPTKDNDDFFPYASDEHSYWTGYFTSRPAFKNMVYRTNNILQVVKQLATTQGAALQDEEFTFKRAMAIAQHHDGVSGTEKQHVADDYALYLYEGLIAGQKIVNGVLKSLFDQNYPDVSFGVWRNISQCEETESNQSFVVTVYNPLSKNAVVPVRFPVASNVKHQVFHQSGAVVDFEIIPIAQSLHKLPGRKSNAVLDLAFLADNLPPLGIVNYYVQVTSENKSTPILQPNANNQDIILDNGLIQVTINGTSGLLRSVKKDGKEWPLHQNFYYYDAMKGYNYNAGTRASGAYIFRPTQQEPRSVSEKANVTLFKGTQIQEIHQTFSPWLSQIIRLYKGSDDLEFEWLVGPIPIIEWTGMEIVTRYTTDLPSNSTFYTDSNGRRWMKRVRNYRKYWNLTITEPVSCNYYPITVGICLKSNDRQFTILTDRPEGATNMNDGQIEVMVHRRLLYDDNFGVVEPLDETAYGDGLVTRGKHRIQFNTLNKAAEAYRMAAIKSAYAPISLVGKTTLKMKEWIEKFNKNISLITENLPSNVQLTSFERWRGSDQILIRLEHIFEANESSTYSQPVTIDLKNLFIQLEINSYEELTLSANILKKDLKRLKWKTEGQSSTKAENITLSDNQVILQPMQIRTFLLNVTRKQ